MSHLSNINSTHPSDILVFDSGVGGLTITKELVSRLPHCRITYAADNAGFPYGTKSEQELITRVNTVLHRLTSHTQADIVVIACNSASTIALPHVRQQFEIPIVGVVPAIKPAAALSQSKVVGLLATPGTIKRDYTDGLINEFAQDCQVVRIGSNALVHLAEAKLSGERVDVSKLENEILPFVDAQNLGLDTVVLACTHFPLLEPELRTCLPFVTHWVNSGAAIARRVESLLPLKAQAKNNNKGPYSAPSYRGIFTKSHPNPEFLTQYLTGWFPAQWTVLSI